MERQTRTGRNAAGCCLFSFCPYALELLLAASLTSTDLESSSISPSFMKESVKATSVEQGITTVQTSSSGVTLVLSVMKQNMQ